MLLNDLRVAGQHARGGYCIGIVERRGKTHTRSMDFSLTFKFNSTNGHHVV